MRLDLEICRQRFADAPFAYLATTSADGQPHIVPITFALVGDDIVTAVDHKPKSTLDLRRIRNVRANPLVAVLTDHREGDWTKLWWVRADGSGRVAEDDSTRDIALDTLAQKYSQYREQRPSGPVIVVTVQRWSGWAYGRR